MAANPARERARQHVSEEIVSGLQERIAQWQQERSRIEAVIQREDRKRDRYELLAELIAAAEAEIAAATQRAVGPRVDTGVLR
ncbi:MAG TPA: hypothetical protein VEC57_20960 [Candidatus Limnocylindrales bacterium]|nr:hypothetical protein [Candidatus Limnocylindrales bacterium]